MRIETKAIVCALRNHGEHGAVVRLMTPEEGLQAAYVRGAVDMQGLTVRAALDQDRDAVGHAVMTDPIVQSHLTLDEAWRLTDAMIEAEAEWLPAWLGGSAAG